MDDVLQAIDAASPIWQQAVFHLSWWHGLVAGAYGVAAWLCFLNVQTTKEAQGSGTFWWLAATVLCVLGANVMLQGDVFVTQASRSLARLQGWYGQRRELQCLALGLVALAVLGFGHFFSRRVESDAPANTHAVGAGLLALLVLLAVRTVSAHGTDAVVNVRYLGLSLGRFFELTALAWVMLGALRSLHRPWVHPTSYPEGFGRHV